jgi:hypothetical protein
MKYAGLAMTSQSTPLHFGRADYYGTLIKSHLIKKDTSCIIMGITRRR